MGGRKSPFPITLASGLYNSLYYRTSRAWYQSQSSKLAHQVTSIITSDKWINKSYSPSRMTCSTWITTCTAVLSVTNLAIASAENPTLNTHSNTWCDFWELQYVDTIQLCCAMNTSLYHVQWVLSSNQTDNTIITWHKLSPTCINKPYIVI